MIADKTIEFWVDEANEYFAEHLQGGKWQELTVDARRGSLKIALALLKRLLNSPIDSADSAQKIALFEQTLYLVENYQNGTIRPPLASETVAEIGSVSYQASRAKSNEMVEYAPIAMRLLAPLLVINRIGRG